MIFLVKLSSDFLFLLIRFLPLQHLALMEFLKTHHFLGTDKQNGSVTGNKQSLGTWEITDMSDTPYTPSRIE